MFPIDLFMASTPVTVRVSLDRDNIKALIKKKLDEALLAAATVVPHVNMDNNFSPSEWWFDKEKTIRHTLQTSAALTYANSVLTLTLTYEVRDKN